jgi:hypothetical protein
MQNIYDALLTIFMEEADIRARGLTVLESSNRLVHALRKADLIIKMQLYFLLGIEKDIPDADRIMQGKMPLATTWQGNITIAQMLEANIKANISKLENITDEMRRGNSVKEPVEKETNSILDRLLSECKFRKAASEFKQNYFGDELDMFSANSYDRHVRCLYRNDQKTDCPATAVFLAITEDNTNE